MSFLRSLDILYQKWDHKWKVIFGASMLLPTSHLSTSLPNKIWIPNSRSNSNSQRDSPLLDQIAWRVALRFVALSLQDI